MTNKIHTALCCTLLLAISASAAAEDATFEITVMTPDTAVKVAQAALADCRSKGFQVAVVVVDRMGVPQAMIRDRYAGPHTPDTAFRKAWTAVSFREPTLTHVRKYNGGVAPGGSQACDQCADARRRRADRGRRLDRRWRRHFRRPRRG